MRAQQRKFLAQFTAHQRVRLETWQRKASALDLLEAQLEAQLQVRAWGAGLGPAGGALERQSWREAGLVAPGQQWGLGEGTACPLGPLGPCGGSPVDHASASLCAVCPKATGPCGSHSVRLQLPLGPGPRHRSAPV